MNATATTATIQDTIDELETQANGDARESKSKNASPKEKRLPIVELFGPTVQGEGMVIGQRTLFVRLGLCDYRCIRCDSLHAVDAIAVKKAARWLTQSELYTEARDLAAKNNVSWITLSGGNPCIHDLTLFCTSCRMQGISIAVETQGTFCPEWLMLCDYVTVSPKSPGMGEKFEFPKYDNFIMSLRDHPGLSCKVVVFSAQDLEFASMIAEMSPALVATDRFYISQGNPYPPTIEGEPTSELTREEELHDSIARYKELIDDMREYPCLKTARVLPQLHTWLWSHDKGR
jgi:7-carboxy-7-deazaguanine synthase